MQMSCGLDRSINQSQRLDRTNKSTATGVKKSSRSKSSHGKASAGLDSTDLIGDILHRCTFTVASRLLVECLVRKGQRI